MYQFTPLLEIYYMERLVSFLPNPKCYLLMLLLILNNWINSVSLYYFHLC